MDISTLGFIASLEPAPSTPDVGKIWLSSELGPPLAFLTVTCSSVTHDNLGSWVVHEGWLGGQSVDVITTMDKRAMFTPRPGFVQQPTVETTHMVYTRGGDQPNNCPYHLGCHRELLGNYAQR